MAGFFLVFILFGLSFTQQVDSFSHAVLLTKESQKVLLLGDQHQPAFDEQNSTHVRCFLDELRKIQLPSLIYYEYDTNLKPEGHAYTVRKIHEQKNTLGEFAVFAPIEGRKTQNKIELCAADILQLIDGYSINATETLDVASWEVFKTRVVAAVRAIYPSVTTKTYLKTRLRTISGFNQRSAKWMSVETRNYFTKLAEQLVCSWAYLKNGLSEVSHDVNAHLADAVLKKLHNTSDTPEPKTLYKNILYLRQLFFDDFEYRIFDYDALYKILENLNKNKDKMVILVAGKKHTTALEQDLLNLGFDLEEKVLQRTEELANSAYMCAWPLTIDFADFFTETSL